MSSKRVRLNRMALKDVVGLQLVSRLKRGPRPQKPATTDPDKQKDEHTVSDKVSVKDTCVNEPLQTLLTEQMAPQSEADAASVPSPPEEKGQESSLQPRRSNDFQSCERKDTEMEREGPLTRDIDQNVLPCLSGLAGSEGSLRRAVRASGCGFCGDCKYISPQQNTSGRQGQKRSSSGPPLPVVTVNPKKIIVWLDPKVTLCDIAQNCNICSQDSVILLPDVLKTKVVRCFKRDMRTGFQFRPGALGRNKLGSDEPALAKNSGLCPRVQSERSICQPQSLTENQNHLKEHTDADTLSGHASHHFLHGLANKTPATCSASFLPGEHTNKGICRTGMCERDVKESPGCDFLRQDMHEDKKVKLGDSVEDSGLPFTSDLESISCHDPAKPRDKEKNGSALKDNCVLEKPCGETADSRQTDAASMPSEQFGQRTELDTDELESLTCQRVRVYCRKTHFSCARTCITWPFSNRGSTLKAHAGTTACPTVSIEPSTRDNSHSPINQNQLGSPSNRTTVMPPNAATATSTNQVSRQNEEKGDDGQRHGREEDGEKEEGHGKGSLQSSAGKNVEFVRLCREESLQSLRSDIAMLSTSKHQRQPGTEVVSPSFLPANRSETDSSISDPSPSALGMNVPCPMSSPLPHGCLSSHLVIPSSHQPLSFAMNEVKGVKLPDARSSCASPTSFPSSPEYLVKMTKEKEKSPCGSSSIAFPHKSDAFLLPPQEKRKKDGDTFTNRSPPKLEPYYNTRPRNYDVVRNNGSLHDVPIEHCLEIDSDMLLLPPLLSPVHSTRWPSQTSLLSQRSCSYNEEEEGEEMPKDVNGHKIFRVHHTPQTCGNSEIGKNDSELFAEGASSPFRSLSNDTPSELQSSPSSEEAVDEDEDNDEDSLDETNHEDDEAEDAQQLSATEVGSSQSGIAGSKRPTTTPEAAGDTQSCILNEFTAYEQDILLVDVIQDDPELFDNLPQKSMLKLGPTRVSEAPKTGPTGVSEQRLTPVNTDFHFNSVDIKDEEVSRPWRPKCSRISFEMQSNTWPTADEQTKTIDQFNGNNKLINQGPERNQLFQMVKSKLNNTSIAGNGPCIKTQVNKMDFRNQKSNSYCRHYFSESRSCMFKQCRFLHVPADEKFCIEIVTQFQKNPSCLQRARAVFTGYYQNNPPGVYFSKPVLLSLLWALLKAGMVSDVFTVLSVSLAHMKVPDHEFLLALFNHVRENGLMGCASELMQITLKMARAGLMLSLDCFDSVKNGPESQQGVHPYSLASVSDKQKSSVSTAATLPGDLNYVHAILEIELCTKQEDWKRMGMVFKSICQSCQHPNQLERVSGHIAIALLSESKDKLLLPFAFFAETVCQGEDDSIIKGFLGRIGVALMLRYHKTHQWAKGQRVVKVLSSNKINYSMLKGLFGNEDGASRCYLITVATELFLLSGSVEGALNTLRENDWFLSSSSWPCELADLENRSCVLMHLAERTSHRDTLEILSNLPGIKEPNDLVDISRYSSRFNAHFQVCMDRQILPVATDTVDFMLGKKLAVDPAKLQFLLHKLGKQNMWLRAREVFRRSLSVGYYAGVSAPPGFNALIVPSQLGEIELALAFEMFITVNATGIVHLTETTSTSLTITLKRTDSCESEYLSAGSRLLSAACIPQPKLIVHYTAVNSSQEQVFALDISSAQRWLRHNHLWANEVWTY